MKYIVIFNHISEKLKMSQIIENILNLINEMAYERKVAEGQITGIGLQVLYHLIKLLKWEDDLNHNKHISDINNWLNQIKRITYKPKSKRFKPEQYYEFLFKEQVKSINDIKTYVNNDLKDYRNLKVKNSDEFIYNELCSLYKKISFDLSKGVFFGLDNYGEIYQKI